MLQVFSLGQNPTVARRTVRGRQPHNLAPRLQSCQHLSEVEVLGRPGPSPRAIGVELSGILKDQRSAQLSWRGVRKQETSCAGWWFLSGGCHAYTIAIHSASISVLSRRRGQSLTTERRRAHCARQLVNATRSQASHRCTYHTVRLTGCVTNKARVTLRTPS